MLSATMTPEDREECIYAMKAKIDHWLDSGNKVTTSQQCITDVDRVLKLYTKYLPKKGN